MLRPAWVWGLKTSRVIELPSNLKGSKPSAIYLKPWVLPVQNITLRFATWVLPCRFLLDWSMVYSEFTANVFVSKTNKVSCSLAQSVFKSFFEPQGISKGDTLFLLKSSDMIGKAPPKPLVRFYNMKKSTKGSIRKAPNAMSWVYSFCNLAATSRHFDANQMMDKWPLGFGSLLAGFNTSCDRMEIL